jgi:hypothetical protein
MTFRVDVKPGPVKYNPPEAKPKLIVDGDSSLHSYWLEKMAASTFYDDAKILHGNSCRCCTRTSTGRRNLMEVQKKK